MTFKILFFVCTVSLIVTCKNHPQKSNENIPSTNAGTIACYRYINKLDTVILKTNSANGLVTGTLVYNFFQKDKYSGTIEGQIKDELLIADFTFFSTGVKSVREVAFKKKGKNLIEGYGETEDKNGKSAFKNIDSLKFTHSIVLVQTDCEK